MFSSKSILALVASLSINVLAQTPQDFQPGTLVKLGVSFSAINIDPPGSIVQSLDQVAIEPTVTVPQVMLLGPNGEMIPDRRFMVMMIDIDVIRDNVATTVLHWFQPDLIMQGAAAPPAPAVGNGTIPSLAVNKDGEVKLEIAKGASITGQDLPANQPDGQAAYFGPGPPPGPPHRYVQVLFAQPRNFSVPACFKNILTNPNAAGADKQARVGFDINQFLAAAQVNPRPIAGNYFRAQNPMPGSLEQNAAATMLVNANCPGVTPAAMAAPPAKFKRWTA